MIAHTTTYRPTDRPTGRVESEPLTTSVIHACPHAKLCAHHGGIR